MRRLLTLALLLIPALAGAQSAPKRPKLHKDADPNDWRSYYYAGMKEVTRNPGKAEAYFVWASRLSPGSAEPLHGRWVAVWLQNPQLLERIAEDPTEWSSPAAVRIDSLLLDALSLDPFTPRQFTRLVYEAMPGAWGNDTFTKGFLAYSEGRYDLATSYLRRSTKGMWAQEARYYRALAFHARKQLDSAVVELDSAARLVEKENARGTRTIYQTAALYDFGVAKLQMQIGRLDLARTSLRRALEQDVSLAAAHHALAQVAEAEGAQEEAIAEYRLAAELRPRNAALRTEYATALVRAKYYDQAAQAFEEAIALEPYDAMAHFNLASTLERMKDMDGARKRYATFLEIAPKVWAEQIAWAETRVKPGPRIP